MIEKINKKFPNGIARLHGYKAYITNAFTENGQIKCEVLMVNNFDSIIAKKTVSIDELSK